MQNKQKIKHTYKVWVEQVNQTCVEVKAFDEDEAKEKAYKEWRKSYAHSIVSYVEKQGD
jgi:hypothetical protein